MTQRRPGLLAALSDAIRAEIELVIESERPTTRQRWLVAARELLVVAAEQTGALLLIDHADQAPAEALALVDDMARLTRGHRIAVVVAGRHPGVDAGEPGWYEVVGCRRPVPAHPARRRPTCPTTWPRPCGWWRCRASGSTSWSCRPRPGWTRPPPTGSSTPRWRPAP